jgi:omega-6 fatty acid desaturase (delta-12 desaturase)
VIETGLKSDTTRVAWFTREERQDYARRLLGFPIALFAGMATVYLGMVVAVLAAPPLAALLLTIPCGMVIGMVFIIGHDAAHNSFTRSRLVNQVIGRLAFLPALHAFSLWDLAHTNHHLYNNLRGVDYVWEPMTPAEYLSRGVLRRAWYRFQRTPIGVAFYYLGEIWAPRLIIPWSFVVRRPSLAHWLDTALVLTFFLLQVTAVVMLGWAFDKSAWFSVLAGIVLPFLVWNGFMSFVIFLHHTHPGIKWFRDSASREARAGVLTGTSWVRFPTPFRQLLFAIMEHNAHHHASGVPLYHLTRMQAALQRQQGDVVTWRFSWRNYSAVCRACKLYDYDTDRWLTFDEAKA